MRLRDISLNNLKRRKGKAAFLIIGLLIGVATGMSVFLVLAASTYPALRAAQMDPTEALRAM